LPQDAKRRAMNIIKRAVLWLQLKSHYSHRKKYFDELFKNEDPYKALTREYESVKFGWVVDCVRDKLHKEALELGCAEGVMTAMLSPYCGKITGVDISGTAIKRAKENRGYGNVEFIEANVVEFEPAKVFNLIVAVDMAYYLGQEHSWEHMEAELSRWVSWLCPGGRLILLNGYNEVTHPKDWLGPHVMEGYRKIMEKAGLKLVKEEIKKYAKDGFSRANLVSVLENIKS